MATISLNTKPQSHTRSISLPSTSDQESLFKEFYRFQDSQEASTSYSESSLIGSKLNALNEMYESVQPFLTLAGTQQSLTKGSCKKQLNIFLDELLCLLDLCATTKDVLSLSMDSARELQLALRRKRCDTHGLTSSVEDYLSKRRQVKKAVYKALVGLQKKISSMIKEDHTTKSNIIILEEMRLNTLTMFESMFTYILGSKSHLMPKGFSIFSKMVGYKRTQYDQTLDESYLKKVDDKLPSLISYEKSKSGSLDVKAIQIGFVNLESHLAALDEQLDCLCRHLIITRVSILNILNF